MDLVMTSELIERMLLWYLVSLMQTVLEKVIKIFKKLFLRKTQVTYKSQGHVNLYQSWKIKKYSGGVCLTQC